MDLNEALLKERMRDLQNEAANDWKVRQALRARKKALYRKDKTRSLSLARFFQSNRSANEPK